MKKIIMAVAIVCAAVMAHGAAANWKFSAANVFNGSGDTTATGRYSGTAYIFDADALSQASLFALFEANTSLDLTKQTGYLASGTVATGTVNANLPANQFSAFEQASGMHNFYFVLVEDDAMYLSASKGFNASGTDAAVTVAMGSQAPGSQSITEGFKGTGTWAAVPEPTSGILLLLGMAGLALRRKRA